MRGISGWPGALIDSLAPRRLTSNTTRTGRSGNRLAYVVLIFRRSVRRCFHWCGHRKSDDAALRDERNVDNGGDHYAAVKDVKVKQTGYSGLMLPILEDTRLAQRWSEGTSLSTHC